MYGRIHVQIQIGTLRLGHKSYYPMLIIYLDLQATVHIDLLIKEAISIPDMHYEYVRCYFIL